MAELPELTLTFLQRQPASAARTLELLAPQDAAELLRHVPTRISAPVVGAMSSVGASRCALHLPASVTAALCEALPWADAAALLRQLEPQRRDAVLGQLPTSMARKFRRSLDYVESTIGAWVEMDAPAIVEDRTVSEATRLLAQLPEFAESHLLLTNHAQQYTGLVPVAALLRASPTIGLAAIAELTCRPARDTASIASVAASASWQITTLLPVVNHRGELLGGITRRTVARALHGPAPVEPTSRHSVLAHLLGAYLVAGEGLLRLMLQGAGSPRAESASREPQ